MKLEFTPQYNSNRKVEYLLDGEFLQITENGKTDTMSVGELQNGNKNDYPIVGLTEDSICVIRFYGEDEKELFEL